MDTFGEKLGALIRLRRERSGYTRRLLAEEAFDDATKERRIAELESGQVANPQAKTFGPIVAFLGISDDELLQCRKSDEIQVTETDIMAHNICTSDFVKESNIYERSTLLIYWSKSKFKSLSTGMGLNKFDFGITTAVLRRLEAEGKLSDNGPYFEGDILMKWGIVDFGVQDADSRFSLFLSEERKLILFGSGKHVIGEDHVCYKYPPSFFGYSGSHLPNIVKFINKCSRWELAGTLREIDGHDFIRSVSPYLVEQRLHFVARDLGMGFDFRIGSPLFVALSDNHFGEAVSKAVVRHQDVDPVEIERAEKARKEAITRGLRRKKFETLCNNLRAAKEIRGLKSYAFVWSDFENFCAEFGEDARESDKRKRRVDFSVFLDSKDVVKFAINNPEKHNFRIEELFIASHNLEMISVASELLDKILNITYYLPGVDVLCFIEKSPKTYALPILRKWQNHPELDVRRWVARVLAQLEGQSRSE